MAKLIWIGSSLWVLWKEPTGYFVGEFQGILWKNPSISFTMYPVATWVGSLQKWSAWTHWSHQNQSDGYFSKVPSKYPVGILRVNCRVLSQRTHTLPGGFFEGKLMGSFQKCLPWACWVKCRWIVSEPSMYSQCTPWVNDPLPPVSTLITFQWLMPLFPNHMPYASRRSHVTPFGVIHIPELTRLADPALRRQKSCV